MVPERPRYYTLDADGEPVPCDDVITWGRWFQTADRRVARDNDEGPGAEPVEVSTVFLGLDHNWHPSGPPILYETLVFGGPLDGEMIRYATRAEAIAGHARMCRWVRVGRRQP